MCISSLGVRVDAIGVSRRLILVAMISATLYFLRLLFLACATVSNARLLGLELEQIAHEAVSGRAEADMFKGYNQTIHAHMQSCPVQNQPISLVLL